MKKIILGTAALLALVGGTCWLVSQKATSGADDAQPENGQDVVEKCDGEKDKEKCLSAEAIKLKDMSVCSLIPEAKNYCLSSYGIEFNEVGACGLVEERQGSQSKELCYQQVAYGTGDENVCYNLPPSGHHYRECFGKVAFMKKDRLLCKETGAYEEFCVRGVDTGTEWVDYRN